MTEQLRSVSGGSKQPGAPDRELVDSAFWHFRRTFDSQLWRLRPGARNFRGLSTLNYLLRYQHVEKSEEALDMVTKTLREMAAGGMHDHLGGGFHRYSVDERWFVPHFEKMLYDQAQLAICYLEAFQITHDAFFAGVAHDILAYVARDLTSPEGAFYSAEDADSADPENPSAHGEGAFYIWHQREIDSVLGSGAAAFRDYYGVKTDGNVENDPHGEFTGRNILFARPGQLEPEGLAAAKQQLFRIREARPRPHLDRKVLTSWNALMISAFARAAGIFP